MTTTDIVFDQPVVIDWWRRRLAAEQQEARVRAWALLSARLSRRQQATWVNHHYIDLRGGDGRQYRITRSLHDSLSTFVDQRHRGREVRRFCVIPVSGGLPLDDVVLTQIMLLRHDPRRFWWAACTWAHGGIETFGGELPAAF